MMCASDVIRKVIKDNGYETFLEFCKDADMNYSSFKRSMCFNKWSYAQVKKIGDLLNVDLTNFAYNKKKYDKE